jgi:SH3-like domain-containing protein
MAAARLRGASPRRLWALIALTAACAACGRAGADDNKDHPTPSGLPVPRYVSLKFDNVNARSGPSDDHRLLWVFHAKGLPVQVIAETEDWRRICDPDGQVSWVHRRTTDGRRMVMRTQKGPATIVSSPNANASVVAYLAPRALAAMDRCKNGWCRIKVGSISGWAPATALWGTVDAPQCR